MSDSRPSGPDPAADGSTGGRLATNLTLFVRLLRQAGLDLPPLPGARFAEALSWVDLTSKRQARQAGRAVLVGRQEHLATFDAVFELFWAALAAPDRHLEMGRLLRRAARVHGGATVGLRSEVPQDDWTDTGEEPLEREAVLTASAREALRHKDFAALTPEEAREVARQLREETFRLPERRLRRRRPAARGPEIDFRRTLRASLRTGGETLRLARRAQRRQRRPLVVLCDVSGSMRPYSRMLLRFLFCLRGASDRVEAFVFGTRLTRITRQLRQKNVDRALADAMAAAPDLDAGTRIGASLKAFHRRWGSRILGRGAIVLLISDGWERGEPELLATQVRRLQGRCHRLLWLSPLLGIPGYEPLTRGLAGALPHTDAFRPVHNLDSLAQLYRILEDLQAGSS